MIDTSPEGEYIYTIKLSKHIGIMNNAYGDTGLTPTAYAGSGQCLTERMCGR